MESLFLLLRVALTLASSALRRPPPFRGSPRVREPGLAQARQSAHAREPSVDAHRIAAEHRRQHFAQLRAVGDWFDEDGKVKSEQTRAFFGQFAAKFANWIELTAPKKEVSEAA